MINWKKGILSLALAGGFVLSTGVFVDANAQGWRWGQRRADRDRDGIPDRRDYRVDRDRDGIDDRVERRRRTDINRNGVPDQIERNRYNYRNRGYYGNNGYYGNRNYGYNGYGYNNSYGYNNGYGYNSAEYQKGYRDGLDRGQEDARDRRNPTPNNSSHFRKGSSVYRQGFSQGYSIGYNQYRRW